MFLVQTITSPRAVRLSWLENVLRPLFRRAILTRKV